eukprot:TRINITY_DN1805_c0_g1_i1.p1 TRINITY_DN1805_c0_g1~~TRINITY_DN1805_c0_g1_i1.p1  ORF type:complete len:335 (+),score=94.35 TRINITY_DN1805_c0_g1_i1:3-1007(+)
MCIRDRYQRRVRGLETSNSCDNLLQQLKKQKRFGVVSLFFLLFLLTKESEQIQSVCQRFSSPFEIIMGCGSSKNPGEDQENDKIERMLRDERNTLDYKVLLLGAGESGKSTVVKQLKSVYKVELDKEELELIATSIHNNTLTCMQCLIHAAEKFGLEFDSSSREMAQRIGGMDPVQSRLPPQIGEDIITLWRNDTIKACWERRSEFWILDAAAYYFEHCHRFIESDFSPNEEDCIMARVRTTGILVTEFDDPPIHFRVVDVAGQKGERKKWIHCFDDVKAVLFVVSLSGYNQVMYEDPTKNQMQDALELFQTISNHPAFKTSEFFPFSKQEGFV